jgi:hypothetical protein
VTHRDPTPLGESPVLVIHGAAVRDRAAFEAEVARLAAAVGSPRPFIPVFWGDLAQPAEAIDEVLPYLGWLSTPAGDPDEAALETMLQETIDEAVDIDVIDGVDMVTGPDDDVGDGGDSLLTRLRGARLRFTPEGERLLDRMGANWRRQSAAARRQVLGRVYRAVRDQYLSMAAHFAGDIILYQRRQIEIQARVWETLIREAPGWGVDGAPVSVISHSLGGSVVFDMAIDGHPRLAIDEWISCACTAPYFHVIGCSPAALAPHVRGSTVALPANVGAWTNFFVPLDPWGYLAAPVFRLADGSAPLDVEVHTGDRRDRLLRHGASHYWSHPLVVDLIRQRITPAG